MGLTSVFLAFSFKLRKVIDEQNAELLERIQNVQMRQSYLVQEDMDSGLKS